MKYRFDQLLDQVQAKPRHKLESDDFASLATEMDQEELIADGELISSQEQLDATNAMSFDVG